MFGLLYSAMSTSILNLSSNLLITIELFWATTDEENKSMGIPSGGHNQGLLVGFVYILIFQFQIVPFKMSDCKKYTIATYGNLYIYGKILKVS